MLNAQWPEDNWTVFIFAMSHENSQNCFFPKNLIVEKAINVEKSV